MNLFYAEYEKNLKEIHDEVRKVISGITPEAMNWKPGEDMNSIAVLVVHLVGAERYWLGDVVLRDPSGRDREAEFAAQGLSEGELIKKLGEAEAYACKVLESLSVEVLDAKRISPRSGKEVTVGWALCHALKHTALHVGHIQITNQLLKQRSL